MGQATLSESLGKSLEGLKNRKSIYTVPWAMQADEQGRLWLNRGYISCRQPFGTYKMKVTKKNDLYICDVSLCKDFCWQRDRGWTDGFPVAQVIGQVKPYMLSKDTRWLISFLIMLLSPVTFIIILVAIPMYVGEYTEWEPGAAVMVSFILWAITMIWAIKEQGC